MWAPEAPPPVLHTSKQVRQETSEIYYTVTPFEFETPLMCRKWLECFAPVISVENIELRITTMRYDVGRDAAGPGEHGGRERALEALGGHVRKLTALEAVARGRGVRTRFEIAVHMIRFLGKWRRWVTRSQLMSISNDEAEECLWGRFKGNGDLE